MLATGAGLLAVGIGLTGSSAQDWRDGARQKIAEEYNAGIPILSNTPSFGLNHFRYIRVEQPRYWTQSATLRKKANILNAADADDPAVRRAAIYDIVRNNRRTNSLKFGERVQFSTN